VVVYVKLKPIVLQKITGPENPTEAHVKFMLEREKKLEEERRAREAARAAEEAERARLVRPRPEPQPDPALGARALPR
jgi:hypothetical protein